MQDDARRHGYWISQEGAQESGRDDLQRHTETVVLAAPICQQLAVGVVQVKVPREFGWRGFACVTTVALLLLIGEEINGQGDASESWTDNCS